MNYEHTTLSPCKIVLDLIQLKYYKNVGGEQDGNKLLILQKIEGWKLEYYNDDIIVISKKE